MTYFLDQPMEVDPGPPSGLTGGLRSRTEGFWARWGLATRSEGFLNFEDRDMRERVMVDLADSIRDRLSEPVSNFTLDPFGLVMTRGLVPAMRVLSAARDEAEQNPGAWADVDLSDDWIATETERRLQDEFRSLALDAALAPEGSFMSDLAVSFGSSMFSQKTLPFLLVGGGSGSLLRVATREAALNAGIEGALFPAQARAAEIYDLETPGLADELLEAAAYGAAFGAGFEALGRGLSYAASLPRPVIPGRSPAATELSIESAVAQMQASDAVPVVPDQMQSAMQGPAPSNLVVLRNDDLSGIEVDAATFQFKAGGDEQGVTDRLRGVQTWEPERAGVALLYEYPDGRRAIVDGHQRLALARRLAAEGQDVELPARVLRAAEGVTTSEARARAAIKNIAEGTGSPTDAAKVFRELGRDAVDLNLPPNSALVRTGDGLSRLSDDAFGMVINGVAREDWGGIVGRTVGDKTLHANILALLSKLKPRNAVEAEAIARDAARATDTEVQASLFGDETIGQTLFLERARVLDQSLKRLKDDKKLFSILVDRQNKITDAGNRLDAEANARKVQDSGALLAYVQSQAHMKGAISDALTDAARALKRGDRGATDKFLSAVRRAVEAGDFDGNTGRAGRDAPEPASPRREDATLDLFGGPVSAEAVMPAPEPDLFSDPVAPKAQDMQQAIGREMRDRIERDGDFPVQWAEDGTPTMMASDLLDELDKADIDVARLELCGRGPT